MSKLWICGITQNQKEAMQELLEPLAPHFDEHCSALFVDGFSTDGTVEVLNKYCYGILSRKWTNDHDFQMNVFLRQGDIKHGDWVFIIDSSERINPDFLARLKSTLIPNFEAQNINTVYQRSKAILFKWHDDMIFYGSPHWGINGQRTHMVDIAKFDGFEDDKTYVWSLRDDINKWITNGIKYYLVYGRSNHMWLIYSPANYPNSNGNLIQEHEKARYRFRDYCRGTLGLPMDGSTSDIMAAFDEFLACEDFADYPEFVSFMNYEKVIANYYRYVRGEDQKEIFSTQNTWKYSV